MIDAGAESLRLFFGLWPDAQQRASLCEAVTMLRLGQDARRVVSDNYHLTLAFIGDVAVSQLDCVREIGRAQRAAACSIQLEAYDYWPKPAVVVAAARVIPDSLQQLWQQLHAALGEHGWAVHPKPLRPHVTLARKVAQAPVPQVMSALEWPARSFSLLCSARSAYTVLDTWPLLDNTGNPWKTLPIARI